MSRIGVRAVVAGVAATAAVGGTLALAVGTPASAVDVEYVVDVPLISGTEGRSFVSAVSDTDPATLLVTVVPTFDDPEAGVYTLDTGTREVTPVFEAPAGTDGSAYGLDISADGRYVLWEDDLPSSSLWDEVVVTDTDSDTRTLVSQSSDEAALDSNATGGQVSDDGRFAIFTTDARNAVPGEAGEAERDEDLFLRDTVDGTTVAVSDVTGIGNLCGFGSATADFATVVFTCIVLEEVSDLTRTVSRSYLWDRATGTRTLIPAPTTGAFTAQVSADGSSLLLVQFSYEVGGTALFVQDVASGATRQVPVDLGANSGIGNAQVSADGRLVLFEVYTLDGGLESYGSEVYLHDLRTGVTGWVSEGLGGVNGAAYLSGEDGVYFFSDGDVPGGPINPYDAFLARFRTFSAPPATSAPSGFVPLDPVRVAENELVGDGRTAYVDLGDEVPARATAVAVNVTLSGVTERTFVSVCAAGTPQVECIETSTVNPYPGRDVANLAFPQVDTDGVLQVYNDEGSVLASVDLVGYFTTTASADFAPITPDRDDEELVLGEGFSRLLTLDDVPTGATAAAVRVTAAGVSANTYLSVCPADLLEEECGYTSTLNARQQDTSNLTVVPVSAATGNQVRVYNNAGSVIVRTDVVGWFVPSGTGSRFVATAPQRVQEREALTGPGTVTRSYTGLVPAPATAVAANVTTAGNTAVSYVSVCPAGTPTATCALTSSVNPNPGQDTASSTLARLGPDSSLLYFLNTGSTLLNTDVQGYFLPRS